MSGIGASAIFGGIGLIGSALQARSTISAGKIQQRVFEAQARNKRLEGRVEFLRSKEQANEILRRTKRALASNVARGYSSGVLPEVGSSAVFSEQQVLRPAALDVGILEQDAFLAIEQSEREARNLEYRGKMAARQARTQAFGNLVMNIGAIGLSGAFSNLLPTSPTSTLPVTPPPIPASVGGSFAGNASQINTAGSVALNRAVNPMFVGQTSPLSGGVYNTAGGGLI